MLDTGLTQNTTVDLLYHATLQLIKENPGKFEQYVRFFEMGCMYLQKDSEEVPSLE